MILSSFKDVLVCDVEEFSIKDENGVVNLYYKVYVYSSRSVIGISCSKHQAESFMALIGSLVSFEAESSEYNGKVKYKLDKDATINC